MSLTRAAASSFCTLVVSSSLRTSLRPRIRFTHTLQPDPANTTQLCHLHGRPRVTVATQSDTQFGVTTKAGDHAKRVKREVRMFSVR